MPEILQNISDTASQHGFFLTWTVFAVAVVGPVMWIRREDGIMTRSMWTMAIGLGVIALSQLFHAFVWRVPLMPLVVLAEFVVMGIVAFKLRQK